MLVHNQLQYGSRFIKQCELFMHLSSAIPWGGTPGKGGDFVKDPVKVLIFPLLGGDTEESKFPSLRGITLSSLKPDKKTVLYTLNEMSCFNSAYMFVTMQIYNTCAIRRGRHRKHEEKGGARSSAQRSSYFFI